MDNEKLEQFKELLLNERKEVLDELMDSDESFKSLIEDESHNVNDSIDIATSTITQNLLKTMNNNLQQKILAIEAALRRIVENAYGNCVYCGNEIEDKRLKSVPWTTKCMTCKTTDSKKR